MSQRTQSEPLESSLEFKKGFETGKLRRILMCCHVLSRSPACCCLACPSNATDLTRQEKSQRKLETLFSGLEDTKTGIVNFDLPCLSPASFVIFQNFSNFAARHFSFQKVHQIYHVMKLFYFIFSCFSRCRSLQVSSRIRKFFT